MTKVVVEIRDAYETSKIIERKEYTGKDAHTLSGLNKGDTIFIKTDGLAYQIKYKIFDMEKDEIYLSNI